MRSRWILTMLLSSVLGLPGQQANSAGASLTFANVNGPTFPLQVTVFSGLLSAIDVRFAGQPQQGFVLAAAPAGVTSPGIPTALGILDLDLSLGFSVLMDGIGFSTGAFFDLIANTGAGGALTLSLVFPAGLGADLGGFQGAMSDPGHPVGVRLTSATALVVTPGAPVAIHVSKSTGSPLGNGSTASPFSTILAGIQASLQAGAPHPPILVARSTGATDDYNEIFTVPDGVSIFGGYDPATWLAVPGARSTVSPNPGLSVASAVTHALTTISNLEFSGALTTSAATSSIAFRVLGVSNALTFTNCVFRSRNAFTGATGAAGVSGLQGGAGANANGPGGGSGGGPAASLNRGGLGGAGAVGNGTAGNHGLPVNQPGTAGDGGAGGVAGGSLNGQNGSPGSQGADGAPGVAPLSPGAVNSSGQWVPAAPGTNGAQGVLGGGGGGGGGGAGVNPVIGSSLTGGGGGGGGQGGQGGGGGGGGPPGGASLAVVLVGASPVFQTCTFIAGNGGNGGAGGPGGAAGPGGAGGTGAAGQNGVINQAGQGGNGGAGGSGGDGGNGPGGAGGPSFCIYRQGSPVPITVNCTFTTGTGGAGGGAIGNAPNGPAGPEGITFP